MENKLANNPNETKQFNRDEFLQKAGGAIYGACFGMESDFLELRLEYCNRLMVEFAKSETFANLPAGRKADFIQYHNDMQFILELLLSMVNAIGEHENEAQKLVNAIPSLLKAACHE